MFVLSLGLRVYASEWPSSCITLFAGINSLGNGYNKDGRAIEDTGQKLTIAKIEEKRGNLDVSANLYRIVLSSRVKLISDSEN